jgi:hypothetical protein
LPAIVFVNAPSIASRMKFPNYSTLQNWFDTLVSWLKITFWVAVIFVLTPLAFWGSFQPTSEQNQYAAQRGESVKSVIKRACEVRADCKSLGFAEKECATAGDIDRCIRIKAPIFAGLTYCTRGEALVFPIEVRPTALQCWRYN